MYNAVKRAIVLLENSPKEHKLELVKRHVNANIDITTVTDHAVIIEGAAVYLEIEYEYFTMEDVCLTNTVTIDINDV